METTIDMNWEKAQKEIMAYGSRLKEKGVERAARQLSTNAANDIKRVFLWYFSQNPRQGRKGGTVRTAHLRNSVHGVIKDKYLFGVGTNVVYARIHELGGVTKPHWIKPRYKKALFWGAKFKSYSVSRKAKYKAYRLGQAMRILSTGEIPGFDYPIKKVWHPGSRFRARHWMSEPMYNSILNFLAELTKELEKPL